MSHGKQQTTFDLRRSSLMALPQVKSVVMAEEISISEVHYFEVNANVLRI